MQSCYVDSPEGDTLLDADAVVDIDIGYATAIFALAFQEFVYRRDETIRYDTRCYFNVRSKADMSRLNLPHGNDN